ncbi:MAG: DUF2905 domain-containing protein [Desulfuromonas sp.]|uniref:DUF2905 domain-containing protein n=1 Tax=Desulfuromonas sp. TaxID=892 RepID=UPI000CB07809|nr:DUF2905 domain-containing protein [Desulfuromonas sp.]PLX85837.1 MAG: DUF2905 domain-containing protein [Desulfuromonas sp.]
MHPGKLLIAAGIALIAAGLFFTFGGKIPFLGRLPGDIAIKRENFSFFFPLTTCILISLLVSFLLWLFRR